MTLLAVTTGNAKVLWYLTRGTGIVALLLLTGSVLLGVLNALRWQGRGWPRFAIGNLHRNLTLLSIAFVALHVVTTVADGFAPIGYTDAFVPFISPYRPIWLGLGTVAFDLLLALVVTSLLRTRVGPKLWRAFHWLAYASWPVAILHSFGTGSDARFGWLELLGFGCVAVVSLAVLARVALGGGYSRPRVAGGATAVLVPLALFAWYSTGPARQGWAARAGTPRAILARKVTPGARVLTSAAEPPTSFVSNVAGSISETSAGAQRVLIRLDLHLQAGPGGAALIDLQGIPTGGGVSLTASGVSFVPATTQAVYTGSVIGLAGNDVEARVTDAAGQRLQLRFNLSIDAAARRVTGTVAATTQSGDGE
jgi:sulfoxide reductase heme-binding subunit YedZ